MDMMEQIVQKVLERIEMTEYIPIEVSAKHIHISKDDLKYLFGEGYELTEARQLSQPGEFLSKERIDIIGPKGILKNVAILGPCREKTQVELSETDAVSIGVEAPIRISGDLSDSETVFIKNGRTILEAKSSTIVAKRHIHIPQCMADRFHVQDKQIVKVRVISGRPLVFDDVAVRIKENSTLNMHIDYDEANSCGYKEGVAGEILLKNYGEEIVDTQNIIKEINNIRKCTGIPAEETECKNYGAKAEFKLEKKVITEEDLKRTMKQGYKKIKIFKKTIVTPLARDFIKKNGIVLFSE